MTGTAAPQTEPVYVAAFAPVANIAVGAETPWGVTGELVRRLPGTGTGTYAGADVDAVLREAGERRVVAVVRDEHRHPWMAEALDGLLAARPDTVVVEMGLPEAPARGPCTSPRTAPPGSAASRPRRRSPGRAPRRTVRFAARRAGTQPGARPSRVRPRRPYRPCQAGFDA